MLRTEVIFMYEWTAVFLTGATLYGSIELLSRGWTHWSMLLAGGFCVCAMYAIANYTHFRTLWKCILCALLITGVEFLCGIIFNMYLDLHIWDYSSRPLNVLGQICPTYTMIWLGLSVPGLWLCKGLHRMVH